MTDFGCLSSVDGWFVDAVARSRGLDVGSTLAVHRDRVAANSDALLAVARLSVDRDKARTIVRHVAEVGGDAIVRLLVRAVYDPEMPAHLAAYIRRVLQTRAVDLEHLGLLAEVVHVDVSDELSNAYQSDHRQAA